MSDLLLWLQSWQAGCLIALAILLVIASLVIVAFFEGREHHRRLIKGEDLDAAYRHRQFSVGRDVKDRLL